MTIEQRKKKSEKTASEKNSESGMCCDELLPEGVCVEELRRAKALNIPLARVGFDYYIHKIIQIQSGERLDQF